MKITIINDARFRRSWEKKACHPLQSWDFGEARRAMGLEMLRVGQWEKNQLKNVFQMSIHRLPFGFGLGYLPRSVLPDYALLKFLYQIGRKKRLIFIKIEPYVKRLEAEEKIKQLKKQLPLIKSQHPLFPQWTQLINLEQSEDELFKKFHYKTRYNIRLAIKKGVKVIEQSNEVGFKIFSQLYFETCKRQHYHGHNLFYHQTIWSHLKRSIAHILIAYYEKIPLAAYQLWFHKDSLYYVYGGSSDQYRNLMASNLLMWEAIRLGKKLKARRFDLWGSLPPNYSQNHPWAGFTRFKEGYGGEFVEMIGSFDLVFNFSFYKIYSVIYSLRQFYLSFL
jgi:lipid II:glycine glycyltransferase (peptidoglycan interpeptide bridge formation enzyme)